MTMSINAPVTTPLRSARVAKSASALSAVPMAWPTVALAIASPSAWIGAVVLGATGLLPLWVAGALATLAAFVTFTPLHDATHQAISKTKWVNELLGRVASIPLLSPFPAFRLVHLLHHKHTNDPATDPDYWSGSGPRWLLPLKWATQDVHYYKFYAQNAHRRPVRERIELVGSVLVVVSVCTVLAVSGYWLQVLALVIVPKIIAIMLLAFAFDYLPHHPHNVLQKTDRYRATTIIDHRWLTPLMLYQNYHLVHHLYPGVPFYRYGKAFVERYDVLKKGGAHRRHLFGTSSPLP